MIVQSGNIYDGTDTVKEVTMAGLKLAKKQGLTAYHFGDEDYVTLNGSIGIGLGLSGGFIMDKTGNVLFCQRRWNSKWSWRNNSNREIERRYKWVEISKIQGCAFRIKH